MKKYYINFASLSVGSTFSFNGNRYFKRSTRTAEIIKPVEYTGTWFYFSNNDLCIIWE